MAYQAINLDRRYKVYTKSVVMFVEVIHSLSHFMNIYCKPLGKIVYERRDAISAWIGILSVRIAREALDVI